MIQLKHTVSKSKRRFIEKDINIDLDLSYIGETGKARILAMGFPSEGSESVYRNPMSEVQRFLELRHKGHYRVYNLCSERTYDAKKFHSVARFPFDDHNCPMFEDIESFCEDVKHWLKQDDENIAVIHCKAGKGRTGLMICCWLLYNGDWEDADGALKYYAAYRTCNQKGVTIPSQIRYIHYFERWLREGALNLRSYFLTDIIFHGVPKGVQDLRFTISKAVRKNEGGRTIHLVPLLHGKKKIKSLIKEAKKQREEEGTEKEAAEESLGGEGGEELTRLVISIKEWVNELPVCGDIKIEFDKVLHFWVNTAFATDNRIILPKAEIDKAAKDTKDKIYPANFKIELRFKVPGGDSSELPATETHRPRHGDSLLTDKRPQGGSSSSSPNRSRASSTSSS